MSTYPELTSEQRAMVDVITTRGTVHEEHAMRTVYNLSKESVDSIEKLQFLVEQSCPVTATRHERIKIASELLQPASGGEYCILPRSIAIRLLEHFQARAFGTNI